MIWQARSSILIKWDVLFLFYNSSKIQSRAALLDSLWQDYTKEFILGLYINVICGWRLDRIVSWVTSSMQSTLGTTFFYRRWLSIAQDFLIFLKEKEIKPTKMGSVALSASCKKGQKKPEPGPSTHLWGRYLYLSILYPFYLAAHVRYFQRRA